MDTLAFGYILPTTGWILDLHQLETCAAERTGKTDDCVVLQSPVSVSSFGILKGSLVLVCCRLKEEHALYAVFDQGHLSFSPKPATKAVLGFVFAVYSRV